MKSIYEVTMIRLEERDIYLAFYTLDRLEETENDPKRLKQLRKFLNGAVNMIKKKFQESLDILDALESEQEALEEPKLKFLIKTYKAFGLFSLGKTAQALKIYQELEEEKSLTEGDTYNLNLCLGLESAQEGKFDVAFEMFSRAKKMYKIKIEASFYLAVIFALLSFWTSSSS